MKGTLQSQQTKYAELLIKIGVNLQPGQSLRIGAELEHAPFVRLLSAAAYRAGARYVQVDWIDTPLTHNRLTLSEPAALDFFPEYEVARHRQMVDEGWARVSLVGPAFPDLLEQVEPATMRRVGQVRSQKLKFYQLSVMKNEMQWLVAAVPTVAWAKQVFPDLTAQQGVQQLWQTILRLCRADLADPITAWQGHNDNLKRVVNFMAQQQVRTIRYFDPTPGPDGQPNTDLTIGLTDQPVWIAASSHTPAGVEFLPNMPTEEVFSTPHNQRTTGWVRTSKPAFPFERKVDNAWFRFAAGEVVEFRAETGQQVLEEFFQIPGARRLGELSLVDVRSPVNQSGLIFYETLFDENAVCHIAFGEAYPEGLAGGNSMTADELIAQGVNKADTHVDFMIGTPTMQVLGLCADGREVTIMQNGQFTPAVLAG